jgi:hypothetical protein
LCLCRIAQGDDAAEAGAHGRGTEWRRIFRHRTIEWAFVAGILLLAGYCFRVTRLFPGRVLATGWS